MPCPPAILHFPGLRTHHLPGGIWTLASLSVCCTLDQTETGLASLFGPPSRSCRTVAFRSCPSDRHCHPCRCLVPWWSSNGTPPDLAGLATSQPLASPLDPALWGFGKRLCTHLVVREAAGRLTTLTATQLMHCRPSIVCVLNAACDCSGVLVCVLLRLLVPPYVVGARTVSRGYLPCLLLLTHPAVLHVVWFCKCSLSLSGAVVSSVTNTTPPWGLFTSELTTADRPASPTNAGRSSKRTAEKPQNLTIGG